MDHQLKDMIENDIVDFTADLLADTYEFCRRQLIQSVTTLLQGGILFGVWNYVIRTDPLPELGILGAIGVAFVAKILLPIHRTDIVPPLSDDELAILRARTEDKRIQRTAVSRGVSIKTKPGDPTKTN